MMLMLKLISSCGIVLSLVELLLELDIPDLTDRDAMELAKRTVLAALRGCLIVDMVWEEYAAGVECIGLEISMSSIESVSSVWFSESSKAGSEGSDGRSCLSPSSMRLQSLEEVSCGSIVFMFW